MKYPDYLAELSEIKIDLESAIKNIQNGNVELAHKYIQQAQKFTERLLSTTIDDDEN